MKQVFICTTSRDECLSAGETILGVLSEDGKRIHQVEPHNIRNRDVESFFREDITSLPVWGGLWEWGVVKGDTVDKAYTLVFKHSKLAAAIVGTKSIADAFKNAIWMDLVDIRPTTEQDYQFMKTGDFKV